MRMLQEITLTSVIFYGACCPPAAAPDTGDAGAGSSPALRPRPNRNVER